MQNQEKHNAKMGKKRSGILNNFYGKRHTLETKILISKKQGGSGEINYCLNCNKEIGFIKPSKQKTGRGKFCSKKCCYEARKVLKGENHPLWTGDKVGYFALHSWIRRKLGKPEKCEICGKENLTGHKIHWANKSGEYKRELNDWIRSCVPCHSNYDRTK